MSSVGTEVNILVKQVKDIFLKTILFISRDSTLFTVGRDLKGGDLSPNNGLLC